MSLTEKFKRIKVRGVGPYRRSLSKTAAPCKIRPERTQTTTTNIKTGIRKDNITQNMIIESFYFLPDLITNRLKNIAHCTSGILFGAIAVRNQPEH